MKPDFVKNPKEGDSKLPHKLDFFKAPKTPEQIFKEEEKKVEELKAANEKLKAENKAAETALNSVSDKEIAEVVDIVKKKAGRPKKVVE